MKVAFTGPICVGKSTLCRAICNNDKGFVLLSNARRLKEATAIISEGIPQLQGDKEQTRQLLIDLGQLVRKHYEDTWVDHTINDSRNKQCVVDDLRFVNEFEKFRQNGFITVFLSATERFMERNYRVRKARPSQGVLNDKSETEKLKFRDKCNYQILLDLDRIVCYELKEFKGEALYEISYSQSYESGDLDELAILILNFLKWKSKNENRHNV
jgi:adenylate kinase family enzyme